MPIRMSCIGVLASLLLACPAVAQMEPPQATREMKARSEQFQAKVAEAMRALDKDPHGVLIQATRGWFLSAARDQKEGVPLAFYDEHGMDKQRAYEIVCLMVGSDPDKFADLANQVEMPQDRQESCAGDYSNASWSWGTALKPHLRAADQPKQKVTVTYGPPGDYATIAQAIKTIGMIEMLADSAADRYVWRRPIGFDVKSCGQPDLHWDLSTQKILVCYEMAQDFANLYRGYGLTYALAPEPAKKAEAPKK